MTARCPHTPAHGGRRRGPSVETASYQLALNGDLHLFRARWDVATWAERLHRMAVAAKGPEAS